MRIIVQALFLIVLVAGCIGAWHLYDNWQHSGSGSQPSVSSQCTQVPEPLCTNGTDCC